MGVSSMGIILAPALGPAVGGRLVDSFCWRYVFFLGVPISLLCIPLTLMFAPGRATDSPRQRLDVLGLALASAAITLLLVGLTNGEREGWNERSEEHTSELQSRGHLVCRLLLEEKNRYTDAYK